MSKFRFKPKRPKPNDLTLALWEADNAKPEDKITADEYLSKANIDEDFTGIITCHYKHGKCKQVHINNEVEG